MKWIWMHSSMTKQQAWATVWQGEVLATLAWMPNHAMLQKDAFAAR